MSASAGSERGSTLALYRRYRSATFAELIGQEHITGPLSTALDTGRINHAYLFSGPRGCGKTSSARILARSLNCAQGPTSTPCGVCDSCRELAPNGPGSIDVIEIDAASHGGVDDARDLRERAYYAPVRDRFKVYIIDEAHMVTSQGFNALLKLVEEPPDFLVFVFATTEPDKVLQTIRSRTHHYPFRLIAPGVLRAHLERICAAEAVAIEPAVYPLVVRAGGGSARDALSLLDQLLAGAGPDGVTYAEALGLLGVTDAALLDDMIDALAVADAATVYATVDRIVEAGHEPRRFAADLLDRLRDLLVIAAVPEATTNGLIDAPAESRERMSDQAHRIGAATAARWAEIVHTALTEMRGTTAPRLVLELVCARMLLPDASTDSAALLQRLERLERRLELGASSNPPPVPVAPPTPAAAPTPAPGQLDAAALRAIWPSVLERVNSASRVTHALMETVQVAGLEGSEVQLVIATPTFAKMLSDQRHTDVIADSIGQLLSGTWKISVSSGFAQSTTAVVRAPASTPDRDPTPEPVTPAESAPADGAPEADGSEWPSVTALPDAATNAEPTTAPSKASQSSGRSRRRVGAATVKATPPKAAPAQVKDAAPDPRDETPEPAEDGAEPATRHDPTADALALLETGLGAKQVDG